MLFTRTILAVGLILAALSGTTARAQEATDVAAGEFEMEAVTYVEAETAFTEGEALELAPAEPELVIETAPVLEAAPVLEPAPIVVPSPTPTPMPTPSPMPTATPAPAVLTGKQTAVVVDNRFQPTSLTIAPGTTITWVNNGSNFHTLSTQDGLFSSGALGGGQSFSYTFQQAGSYVLICRQHLLNGMSGRITVQ
jgi:plastocyanin